VRSTGRIRIDPMIAVLGDDPGGVAADSEKGRAREVDHAGIAELDGQPERRDHQQQGGGHHQDDEMLLMEPERDGEHAHDRGDVEGAFVAADARSDPIHHPETRAQHDGGGRDCQQRSQRPLAFRAEEQHAVQRRERRPDECGK
jgi:hypothetical protein